MVTWDHMNEFVSKLGNKVYWTARALSRPTPIEVLYDNGNPDKPEHIRAVNKRVFIDPLHGYAITEDGVLIEDSMTPNFRMPTANWRNGLPSPAWFKNALEDASRIDYYPCVVSLRHFWEWNYYHFLMDVLGKLSLLDRQGIDPALPLALGRYVGEFRFASDFIRLGRLKDRHWLIPDKDNHRVIATDKLIYCRVDGHSYRDRASYTVGQMDLPFTPPRDGMRVFLNRPAPATRRIVNLDQVSTVLDHFNFTCADTTGMPVVDQLELFSKTRYLVAIHGAGVTNVIFRRGAPLSLLELHARSYINDDMMLMAGEFGYVYDRLKCEPQPGAKAQQANISVDASKLRLKIERMLGA